MTNLIATARYLAEHKNQWSGTVLFIGQPAEEKIGGAKEMLADGLYTRFPKPDFALALHVTHDLEAGKLAYTSGPAMAGSTSVDVLVKGKGGHGAMPQNTVDPIVLASLLVLDLQSIVSREVNPIHPAVVTVGSIHGGTKHNIIPNDVRLQLTLRAFNARSWSSTRRRHPPPGQRVGPGPPGSRARRHDRREHPADGQHAEPGGQGRPDAGRGGRDLERLRDRAHDGGGRLRPLRPGGRADLHVPAGHDPARAAGRRQGQGETMPSLHSALYYPDAPPSLRTGVKAMTAAVVGLLPPGVERAPR